MSHDRPEDKLEDQSEASSDSTLTSNDFVPRTIATRFTDTDPSSALQRYIGSVMRQARKSQQLNIGDVAERADLSRGMVSKIENGQVTASLDSLARLTDVLDLTFSQLFRDYDSSETAGQLIKSGEDNEVICLGTEKGYTYQLLSYNRGQRRNFERFLISMDDESQAFPTFQHQGIQFIHMLQGEIDYRHGKYVYTLEEGDSFTFDARVPHGPERLVAVPIRFLAITIFVDNS